MAPLGADHPGRFLSLSTAGEAALSTDENKETENMETAKTQRDPILVAMSPAPVPRQFNPPVASSAYAGADGDLSVLLKGRRLQINANVDLVGLARLKEVLGKYEEILALF